MCQAPDDNGASIRGRSPIPSMFDVIWFGVPGKNLTLWAAGSGGPPSGCRFLDQALQRQPHRVVNVGCGEVGAAELQLGDEAPEKYAALFYRQAGGGRPDRSKLRIRQSQHAVMLGVTDVNFLTN